MRKNKLNRIFILLLFIATFTSCKKETLTSATQVGANTFSCRVNGVIHIPNNEAFSVDAISTRMYLNDDPNFYNLTVLTNYSRKKPAEKIYITLYKVNQPGIYKLVSSEFRFGEYRVLVPEPFGGIIYDSRTLNNGEVNITKLDRVNKIISGTFSFEAINKNNANDKVSITDGRFDLKF